MSTSQQQHPRQGRATIQTTTAASQPMPAPMMPNQLPSPAPRSLQLAQACPPPLPGTRRRARRRARIAALAAAGLAASAMPARADLRLCNMTGSRVGVALGYRDAQGWITEGWWNLSAKACETLLKGGLAGRFYYIYATDYDRGGEWTGKSFMCTRDREFSIRGVEDCLSRGYDRNGFFEIDTGEQKSWTVQLTDSNRPGEAPR